MYPDTYLEGKIELIQEAGNGYCNKYIYLVYPESEAPQAGTEYNCYHYPLEGMYDNSEFIYSMSNNDAYKIMEEMKQMYSLFKKVDGN